MGAAERVRGIDAFEVTEPGRTKNKEKTARAAPVPAWEGIQMRNSLLERFQLTYHDPQKDGKVLIIGIDFGDGEYAAAQASPGEKGVKLDDRLKVSNGRDFTEFAVYGHIKENGKVVLEGVGQKFVNMDKVESYANFKRRPGNGPGTSSEIYSSGPKKSLTGYTYGHLMSHAFSHLVNTILRENAFLEGADTEKKQVYLFVGRPSSARWEAAEQAYAKMLAKDLKTYPNIEFHVAVISEAKAAMAKEYYAYRQKKAGGDTGPNIQKETIAIIDGGSSTFDCVVVRDGRVICEYSRQIGAGKLDQNFLDIQLFVSPLFKDQTVQGCAKQLNMSDMLKHISPEEAAKPVTQASAAVRTAIRGAVFAQLDDNNAPRIEPMGKVLVELRAAKENYFGPSGNDGNETEKYSLDYTSKTGTDLPTDLSLRFRYALKQAVSGMPVTVEASYSDAEPYDGHKNVEYPSFQAALEAFFKGARATWKRNGVDKPDRIIVTGGATLMPFVNEIMERCFEIKKQKITISPPSGNRHFSVSAGVAYIGFVELYKEKIYREVCKKCDGFVDAMKDKLKEALTDAVTDYEWDDTQSWVDTWVNDSDCTTMRSLNNLSHKPPKKSWDSYVQEKFEACIKKHLIKEVQKYLKDKTARMFPNAKEFNFSLDVISLSRVGCIKPTLLFNNNLFRANGLLGRLAQRFEGVPLLDSDAFMSYDAKVTVSKNVRENEWEFRQSIRNQMLNLGNQVDDAAKKIKTKLHTQLESYVEKLDDFFVREDFKQG